MIATTQSSDRKLITDQIETILMSDAYYVGTATTKHTDAIDERGLEKSV
jgi:hypothetical protein